MKLTAPLTVEIISWVVSAWERSTTNGKNVKNTLQMLEAAASNGHTEYFIKKTSDFKWGYRKNRPEGWEFERIGVVQHGRGGNYYVWLGLYKEGAL